MRVMVLFSGAKDSTFAIYKVIRAGHEVVSLASMVPENPESYMFHHPNIEWTSMQADAMGIPIITKRTAGEKEKELEDLENVIRELKENENLGGVVSGALASHYQKSRIDNICQKLELESIAPLWGTDPTIHWNNILETGFEVIITSVASEGLEKDWLGRKINKKTLKELEILSKKHGFNLAGEGGEFETFVLNGPIFKKRLVIIDTESTWRDDSGSYVIRKLKLSEKIKT
jgi:ABC transporter with metal-binding/Fe-S-binding domain ATP-binding protein